MEWLCGESRSRSRAIPLGGSDALSNSNNSSSSSQSGHTSPALLSPLTPLALESVTYRHRLASAAFRYSPSALSVLLVLLACSDYYSPVSISTITRSPTSFILHRSHHPISSRSLLYRTFHPRYSHCRLFCQLSSLLPSFPHDSACLVACPT